MIANAANLSFNLLFIYLRNKKKTSLAKNHAKLKSFGVLPRIQFEKEIFKICLINVFLTSSISDNNNILENDLLIFYKWNCL